MIKLWNQNDGFRLLIYSFIGFILIVLLAHLIELIWFPEPELPTFFV